MSVPSLPTGYDSAKLVDAGRPDCQLTVGFDSHRGHVPRFLVQLHYQAPGTDWWETIARIDHNKTSLLGHDVYQEGLHVDVERRTDEEVHLELLHGSLAPNPGAVMRDCVDYFKREADYFIDVFEERRTPGQPPRWSSDGGTSSPTFICSNPVEDIMSQESSPDDALSVEELTELLADATDTTPEEIERQAAAMEIAPPEDATLAEDD